MGFRSLQHSRDRRSTGHGLCLPATFRPQGLATLSTAYALRAPAGFLSHRRRSWDSPFGASSSRKVSTAFPRRKDPRTVSPVGFPAAEAVGRPHGPRFLGFDPSGSPWRRAGFNSPTAGCSLGLYPPRVFRRRPCLSSRSRLLPRASQTRPLSRIRRRPGVSIGLRLTSSTYPASRAAGRGNPHRVLAPVRPRHSRHTAPGPIF